MKKSNDFLNDWKSAGCFWYGLPISSFLCGCFTKNSMRLLYPLWLFV